jgi:hypothetical protein
LLLLLVLHWLGLLVPQLGLLSPVLLESSQTLML